MNNKDSEALKPVEPDLKDKKVKIVHLDAVALPLADPNRASVNVYGLGDDGLIYVYIARERQWRHLV